MVGLLMIKETITVDMSEDFRKKAMKVLDKTIEDVLVKKNATLTNKEKRKIKNLSLDQVNINMSQRGKSKSMWVFDTELSIPVSVRTEKKLISAHIHSLKNPEMKYFKEQNNLTWTYETSNANSEEGLNRSEFCEVILRSLLEDFETAAFYGVLSYVED